MGGTLTLGALDLLTDPFHAQLRTSFGAWQPITTSTDSLFLDGSVVSGDSTGNREVLLVVAVEAGSRAVLGQACEALVSELNAASNLLIWTPDGGIAQVYETYRAGVVSRRDDEDPDNLRRVYEVTIPARPWVRSLARQQAVASAAAGVVVDDMEVSAAGVAMQRQIAGVFFAGTGMAATGGPTVDPAVTPLARLVDVGIQGGVVSATGGMVADATVGGVRASQVTASSAGTLVAKTAAVSTSDGYVTVDWAAVYDTSTAVVRTYQAGIEWQDAAGSVVRTDWGPVVSFATGQNTTPRAISVASPRLGAAKARPLLRYTALGSGEKLDVFAVTVQPSAVGTVAPLSTPTHDGSGSVGASVLTAQDYYDSPFYHRFATPYVHRVLPAPVDVSGQVMLRVWFLYDAGSRLLSPPSIRLWDSAGRWTRFGFGTSLADGTWVLLSAALASPTETSSTPCDLTDVVAWDMTVALYVTDTRSWETSYTLAAYVDTLTAGPADSPMTSTRGSVLTLGPILGSARTTAGITVSSPTAMSSLLVACIDGTTGDPLLSIVSNKASGSGYSGVYSVIAALNLNVAPTNPTVVVSQKIAGTVVATQTLTGTQPAGLWYVDFGSVALPLVPVPLENVSVTYDFALSTTGTPPWADLLVVDINASMVWLSSLSTARKVVMVDEPPPAADLGGIWVGDALDRTDGRAPMTPGVPTRPLHVSGPSTRLLVYSAGTGIITLSAMVLYWPRWVAEALV